jgi:PAS domain S-box-containing protein
VVVLTSLHDEQIGLGAIREGAADYLNKGKANVFLLGRSMHYAFERRRTSELLRESERKHSLLFANMQEGLALHEIIYDADHKPIDYVITDVNPAFECITGLKKEAVIGQKASVLYKSGESSYLDIYARVAETGQSTAFETYFPPSKKHFFISACSPAKGQFATLFSDITERKRYEEDLQQGIHKLHVALRGVITVQQDGGAEDPTLAATRSG